MKWFVIVLSVMAVMLAGCQLNPVAAKLPAKASRIAFMSNRDGADFEIFVMDRDGGNLTNLTVRTSGNKILPAWSTPARSFAYLAEQEEGGLTVYSMDDHGENAKALSGDLLVDPGPVVWSPNGKWVGFGVGRETNAEVYVADAGGEKLINLSNHPGEDLFSGWSPDGEQVLFVSDRDGNLTIYLVDVEGGEPMQLTNPAFASGRPDWSPDGSKVAFMTNRDADIEIYVISTEDGEVSRLTENPGFDGYPAWSPDGEKIAFLTDRDGNAEIYVMNADGSDPVNLTNTPDSHESVQGDFTWSPDGQQIMYHANRNENIEIYVMDADGSNQINLSNSPAIDFASVWVR